MAHAPGGALVHRLPASFDVALVADKGGVGKSLLSFHLAVRLRQLGVDVALLDLDQSRTSSLWAAGDGEPHVPFYTLDQGEPDGLSAHQGRILDTPAHPGAGLRAQLDEVVDLTLLVVSSDIGSHLAAARLARAMGESERPRAVVINNNHPRSRRPEEIATSLRQLGLPLAGVVRRFAAYEYAQLNAVPVCQYPADKSDDAWSDICGLADYVVSVLSRSEEMAHA